MRVLRYGDRAVLVEPSDPADVLPLCDAVATLGLACVPAARTLLVEYDPAVLDLARLGALIEALPLHPVGRVEKDEIVLTVRYDGADLAAVPGCDPAEVVRLHTLATYTVAFCGFAPGFAYLSGLDPRLHVPRLDAPRVSVPAGAVAIAGEYSAVYPRASPGGWRLLGRTDAPLWDSSRADPALLSPGMRVRFEAA